MKLHLFNPENDLALGLGCRNYTPPPHAAALHRAGALMPLWWAGEGDAVVAPMASEDDLRWMQELFGLSCSKKFDPQAVIPSPWGWSLDAKRQFLAAGCAPEVLPSDAAIDRYRQLSHRRSAIALLRKLGYEGVMPVVTENVEEAMEFVSRNGSCFVKSPWSGSGRGVFNTTGLSSDALRARIEGIIHRQGSVIVEKALDKVRDFALLFSAEGGKVTYRGISAFETEPRGMYVGNIVAPQEVIRGMIKGCEDMIDPVGCALEAVIGESGYEGPIGVDMLTYRDENGREAIMPCIEINFRMTMGFAAMAVANKLSVTTPSLLAWHRGTPPPHAIQLLPRVNDFTLIMELL